MMNRLTADAARDVLLEDKAVCEAVQRGLPDAQRSGLLSDEEERVLRFQEAYMQAVGSPVTA